MALILRILTALIIGIPAHSETGLSLAFYDQQGKPLADVVLSAGGDSLTQTALPLAVMDQVNKQFRPSVLVVHKGQSVSFPNSDNIRHHVYSFSSPKPFEIRLYADTPKDPVLFDQPGVVVLGCNIHDQMIGYIYVADSAYTFISDQQGRMVLPTLPPSSTVTLWHPRLSLSESERLTLTLQDLNALPVSGGRIQITLTLAVDAAVSPQEEQGFGNKLRR
ncbi:MAG: methylamine utilization protein [Saccharospirillaceae bacterium]|nr:methylamine utilization protein [Saccharospirillaceae bacterium]MCD8531011.1 methylamine utilization protein [Saccharospirillaceae bacterium]